MLRRTVSTVKAHAKFWSPVLRPVAMSASSCCVEHDVSNQRFIIYLENGEYFVSVASAVSRCILVPKLLHFSFYPLNDMALFVCLSQVAV